MRKYFRWIFYTILYSICLIILPNNITMVVTIIQCIILIIFVFFSYHFQRKD
jgi:hypothetical protein